MGASSFDALLRSLSKQGAAEPVYYLHGDEDVLKDEALQALLDRALDAASRAFNLDQRSAAELDPDALHALVNTPPLLAERRVVVVRGVEHLKRKSRLRDELLRYLADPSPTTLLVLIQSAGSAPEADLAAGATLVECPRLDPARVPRWVAHRAHALGLALEPDAVDLLARAVGNDLGHLARELDKLAGLAGRTVTAADVTAFVGIRRDATVYDLVDAALERRPADAAGLVEPVLEQTGMSGVRVVTAIGTALVGTALARAELDAGTPRPRLPDTVFRQLLAARPFGLRNWKDEAARFARWAEAWRAGELDAALRRALAADRALKSATVSDERGLVLELLLGMAVHAREAA